MENSIQCYKRVFGIVCLVVLLFIQSVSLSHAKSFSNKIEVLNLIRDTPGKVVVLSMSASWCAVCKAEVKELNRLQAFYKGKVVVYGLALDKEKEKIEEFVKETGALYPIYQITEEIGRDFRVSVIPHLFFYDPNGILYMDAVGLQDMDTLREIVDTGLVVDEHAGHNHD